MILRTTNDDDDNKIRLTASTTTTNNNTKVRQQTATTQSRPNTFLEPLLTPINSVVQTLHVVGDDVGVIGCVAVGKSDGYQLGVSNTFLVGETAVRETIRFFIWETVGDGILESLSGQWFVR